MTFEIKPRQRTDYRFFSFWREKIKLDKHIIKFKHMLKDTFNVDRMIWKRKVKERSGISHFFFLSFDTMSVYYNANLKGSQVNLS